DLERRVGEAVAERIERRDVAEQVAAPRARLVVVERRNLADFARDGDRQLAARIDAAEQRIGNRGALLFAGVPGLEDRVGFLGEFRIARGTAVDEDRDDRLADGLQRAEQFELLADEVEARAVAEVRFGPTFAAGLLGVADEQQDRVGIARGFDRRGDALTVLLGVAEYAFVRPPVVVLCDHDALRVNDVGAVADEIADAFERRNRAARFAIVAAEPRDIGIGPDHRDGRLRTAGSGKRKREDAVVLEQHQRLFGRLAGKGDAFGTVGTAR